MIEESSCEYNVQDAEEYYQEEEKTLARIQKEIMHTPVLSIKSCKGKAKVVDSEDGSGSKPLEDEEAHVQFDIMELYLEVEVSNKSL